MKNILILAVLGVVTSMAFCYAIVEAKDSDINLETNASIEVNADAPSGVTTSMNGNTTTSTGIPISSTSASSEGGKR